MLAEVAEFGIGAEATFAFLKTHHASHDFQQGGFAGAIRPTARCARHAHVEAQVLIDLLLAVGLMDALQEMTRWTAAWPVAGN